MDWKCRDVSRVERFAHTVALLCLFLVVTACSDSGTPPKIEAHAYSSASTTVNCATGMRGGQAGATDGEVTADGIRYNVRAPSNYDATFAHPLLMVFAPAGQNRWMSERFTGLTPSATAAGFVVVYADHRPLGIPAIEQLSTIPGLVAKQWCIDENRIYLTGHSDGGTVSLALALLNQTNRLPSGIASSAAGWTGKDLEAHQCRAPIPVMIMHSANDKLFPGWGAQTGAWWAACNQCDVATTKQLDRGCIAYQQCAPGGATLYCEGTGGHREWPHLNRLMLDFFVHPENFQ
jgi:polyhydroxybutyrate depolymerase